MGPCCFGLKPQAAVKLFAIVDIVITSLQFLFWCLILFLVVYHHYHHESTAPLESEENKGLENKSDAETEDFEYFSATFYITWALGAAFCIVEIAFGIFLLLGAMERSVTKCRTWLTFQYVMISFNTILFLISIFDGFFNAVEIILVLIEIAYRCYMVWVVRDFIIDIRSTSVPVRFE